MFFSLISLFKLSENFGILDLEIQLNFFLLASKFELNNYRNQKNWSGSAEKCVLSRLRRSFFALEKSFRQIFSMKIYTKNWTEKQDITESIDSERSNSPKTLN